MTVLFVVFACCVLHGGGCDWVQLGIVLSQKGIPFYGTEPSGREHGTGFLSDWVMQLIDTTGRVHYYYTDLEFQLVAVPACGRVFTWNSETSDVDGEILAVDGVQRSVNKCDTDHKE